MKKKLGIPATIIILLELAWHLLLLYTKKDDLANGGLDELVKLGAIDSTQKTCYTGWYISLAVVAVCLLLVLILRQKNMLFVLLIVSGLQIILSFVAGSAEMLGINEKLVPTALPIITAVLSLLAFLLANKSLTADSNL